MRILLLSLMFWLPALSAFAHDLNVRVTDANGAPVPDAVVFVAAPNGAALPASFAWPNLMEQKDIQFAPYILVAPLGSKVQFPNRDRVRHHVYSFSKGNRFELKLYGQEESRFIEFKTPGIVAVGCNIHDGMIGYIRIVDTPFANRTDANGKATLTGLPSATGNVTVWHPDLAGGKDVVSAFNTAGPETVVALGGAASAAHAHH